MRKIRMIIMTTPAMQPTTIAAIILLSSPSLHPSQSPPLPGNNTAWRHMETTLQSKAKQSKDVFYEGAGSMPIYTSTPVQLLSRKSPFSPLFSLSPLSSSYSLSLPSSLPLSLPTPYPALKVEVRGVDSGKIFELLHSCRWVLADFEILEVWSSDWVQS